MYGATYDSVGNPLTLTDPEGVTEYSYDNLDRLTSGVASGKSNGRPAAKVLADARRGLKRAR